MKLWGLLVTLLIFVVVAGRIYYVLTLKPLPEPWKQASLVICAVIILLLFGIGTVHLLR